MKLSPSLDSLSPQRRASMLAAAREIRECYRVLEKAGINLVGEVKFNFCAKMFGLLLEQLT